MSATQAGTTPSNSPQPAPWRLKVIAEADPSALTRILQHFQRLNVIPHRVHAERLGETYLEIAIEISAADVLPDTQHLITAKLGQLPIVLIAVTCD